jgi:transcriptional/translational regulatory protein YebC/TACO1
LESLGVSVEEAQLILQPKTTIRVEGKDAEQVLRFYEILEDHDDVQNIFGNFDIPDEVMAALAE